MLHDTDPVHLDGNKLGLRSGAPQVLNQEFLAVCLAVEAICGDVFSWVT